MLNTAWHSGHTSGSYFHYLVDLLLPLAIFLSSGLRQGEGGFTPLHEGHHIFSDLFLPSDLPVPFSSLALLIQVKLFTSPPPSYSAFLLRISFLSPFPSRPLLLP